MSNGFSALAAGASAAASTAASAGLAPTYVIAWALGGGVAAVFIDKPKEVVISFGWAFGALGKVLISAAAGVAMSAGALAVFPSYSMLAPLANIPQWAMAFMIAATIFKLGPILLFGGLQKIGIQQPPAKPVRSRK